jgi:hypothetical protein
MSENSIKASSPKVNPQKTNLAAPSPPLNAAGLMKKPSKPALTAANPIKDEHSSLKEAALAVQQIRLSVQQELQMARKMRSDAMRYQQDTATKARSEAQQLLLRARLATQREIEELIRQSSEEIQKLLADIRVIRITAQEELAAQRKFTDAAKITSMSMTIQDDFDKPERKKKDQLVSANS